MWTVQSYGSKVTMSFLEGSFMLLLLFYALFWVLDLTYWVVSVVGMQLLGPQLSVVSVWRKSWEAQTISARRVTEEEHGLQRLILQLGCVVLVSGESCWFIVRLNVVLVLFCFLDAFVIWRDWRTWASFNFAWNVELHYNKQAFT
jgi:hypothetical protein